MGTSLSSLACLPAFGLHRAGFFSSTVSQCAWTGSQHRFSQSSALTVRVDLISILGCTEDEYRDLIRFALLKSRTRPAEYDCIPEIVNDPVVTPIVVNLVIGLALTAVSALLRPETPEVQQPERRITSQGNLSNQIGPSRFNQTSSFDGYASLVSYGSPVALPFGKMGTSADGSSTGGLVLAASLVCPAPTQRATTSESNSSTPLVNGSPPHQRSVASGLERVYFHP